MGGLLNEDIEDPSPVLGRGAPDGVGSHPLGSREDATSPGEVAVETCLEDEPEEPRTVGFGGRCHSTLLTRDVGGYDGPVWSGRDCHRRNGLERLRFNGPPKTPWW